MKNIITFISQPYHRGGVTRWMVDMAIYYANNGFEVNYITVCPVKRFISAPKSDTIIDLLKQGNFTGNIISQKVDTIFELSSASYKARIYKNLIQQFIAKDTAIIVSDDYAVWKGVASVAQSYKMIGVVHCSVSEFYYQQCMEFKEQLSGIVVVSQRCNTKLKQTEIPVLIQPCSINLNHGEINKTFDNQLNIVWAGRMENSQKRIFDFIPIALQLNELDFKFKINLIGDGSDKEKLENEVKKHNLSEYFVFHGWQQKAFIQDVLKNAHIYVLPSAYEGYPVAIMEALAEGCGIVSSRVSGIEDLEKDSETSQILKVFEIGNIDEATSAIISFKDSDFNKLSTQAQKIAQKHFSMKNCADNYWNFISNEACKTKIIKNAPLSVNLIKEHLLAYLRLIKFKLS
ncbi:MAG: glycosyltransferase [Cytophagales bacterium]